MFTLKNLARKGLSLKTESVFQIFLCGRWSPLFEGEFRLQEHSGEVNKHWICCSERFNVKDRYKLSTYII